MVFVAITDKQGATLVVTYKGAHASRPADEMDVDSFIAIKSHRAKGKRITTYEVDTLSFVEPEEPESSLAEEAAVEDDVEPMIEQGLDIGEAMDIVPEDIDQDVEIEQGDEPTEEVVMDIHPEQLNLF